ncbi:MAG: DpnI domain-containing protein [Anaerolineales bacterium]|nr:DpnI domain-containing protein [Anaerolineales bacterium]
MATKYQELGERGELLIVKHCKCPQCKRPNTLKRLRANFRCADIICDFCGYIAQVKSQTKKNIDELPSSILGAAWGPQRERMESGIYFPLFIVLVNENKFSIFYLPSDLQIPELFIPRKPLSKDARRAGWQGFRYDLSVIPNGAIIRVV